jgi:uncharacterized membrane protein YccC
MSSLRRLLDRRGGIVLGSILLGAVIWVATSSLLGFGLVLVLPSLVARVARR